MLLSVCILLLGLLVHNIVTHCFFAGALIGDTDVTKCKTGRGMHKVCDLVAVFYTNMQVVVQCHSVSFGICRQSSFVSWAETIGAQYDLHSIAQVSFLMLVHHLSCCCSVV